MIKHYNLTMDGSIQKLSSVLPAGEGDLLKYAAIQADAANSNVIFVGSTEIGTLTSADYGWRIEVPVSSIPTAPDIIELGQNGFSLNELSVLGTAPDVLHIMVLR